MPLPTWAGKLSTGVLARSTPESSKLRGSASLGAIEGRSRMTREAIRERFRKTGWVRSRIDAIRQLRAIRD